MVAKIKKKWFDSSPTIKPANLKRFFFLNKRFISSINTYKPYNKYQVSLVCTLGQIRTDKDV